MLCVGVDATGSQRIRPDFASPEMVPLLSCFICPTYSSDEERCQVARCHLREPAALQQERSGASTRVSSIKSQEDLSQSFGQSARGVLVLARPARSHSDGTQTLAVYCNPAAAALLSSFPVSGLNGDDARHAAECLLGLLQTTEPQLVKELLEHLTRATAGDPAGKLTLFLDANKYPNPAAFKDANCRQCLAIAYGDGNSGVRAVGGNGRPRKSVTSESAVSTGAAKASSPTSGVAAPIRRWLHALVEPISYDPGPANTGGTSLQAAHISSANAPISAVLGLVLQRWLARSLPATASGNDGDAGWWHAVIVTFQPAAEVQPHQDDCGRLSAEAARGKGAECGGGTGAAASAVALELCTGASAPSTTAAATASANIATNTPDRPLSCALGLASTMSIGTAAIADDSGGMQRRGACRTTGASELTSSVVRWSEAEPTWPLVPSMPLAASMTSQAAGAGGGAAAAGGASCGDGPEDGGRDMDMAIRLREQMVLEGLTPMTTAVSVSNGAILYQNVTSVAYFGQRVRQGAVTVPTTPAHRAIEPGTASGHARSVAEFVPAAESGGGVNTSTVCGKLHLLRELFRLEPHKLDRLLLEVCVEGRLWRGIIRVPAACLPPSSPQGILLPAPVVAAAAAVAAPPSSSTRALAGPHSRSIRVLVAKACQPGPIVGEVSRVSFGGERWTLTELNSQRPSLSQSAAAPLLGHPDTLAAQQQLEAVRLQAGPSPSTIIGQRESAPATSATAAARATAGTATEPSTGCTSESLLLSTYTNALNNDGDGALRPPAGAAGLRPSQAAAMTGADPLATSTWGLFMESSDHRGLDSGGVFTPLITAPAAIDGFYRHPSSIHPAPGTAAAASCTRARAPVVPAPPLRHLQHLHRQYQPQHHPQGDTLDGQEPSPLPLSKGDPAAIAYTAAGAAVAAPVVDAMLAEEVHPSRCYPAPKVPVGGGGAGAAAAAAAGSATAGRPPHRPRHTPTEDNPNPAAARQPDGQRDTASSAAAMPGSAGVVAALGGAEEIAAGQSSRNTLDRSRGGRVGLNLGGGDGSIWGSQARGVLPSGARTGGMLVGRTVSFTAGSLRAFPIPMSSAVAVSTAAMAASPWPRQPVQRVLSRGQVEFAGAGTIARILAFTSSLRSTPTAVQAALQQAVAGSLPLGLVNRGDSAAVPPPDVSTTGGGTRRTAPFVRAVTVDAFPTNTAATSDVAWTVRPSALPGVVASTATTSIAGDATPCARSAAVASAVGAGSTAATSSRAILNTSIIAASTGAFKPLRKVTVIPASNSMPDLTRMARSSADDSSRPATIAAATAAPPTATAANCTMTSAAVHSGGIANRAGFLASSAAVVSTAARSASGALAASNDTLSGWMKSLRPASTAARFIFGARWRRRCQRQEGAYGGTASGLEARRVASDFPARRQTATLGGSAGEPCGSNVLNLPPPAAAPLLRQPSSRTLASDVSKATASPVAAAGGGVAVAADSDGVMGCGGEHICARVPQATCGDNDGRGVIGGGWGISGNEARVSLSGSAIAASAAPSADGLLGTPPCGAGDGGGGGGGGGDRLPSPLQPGTCWHEVVASPAVDPITGQDVIILSQTDISAKVEAECHIALVSEAEHRLLEQIFPRHVLAYMTEEDRPTLAAPAGGSPPPHIAATGGLRPQQPGRRAPPRDINKLATSHSEVTLLFADIQGFTPMCKVLEPRVVMAFLNDLFTMFDRRLDEFGVYKVETIGDCYFVAGGLIHEDEFGMPAVRARDSHADPLHAEKVLMFAKAMLAAAAQVTLPTTGGPVKMRIGIHTGPVVSGVVGQRMPRFCLFGDTVNTASRMESTGVPGCIHASEAARRLLRNESWVPTGGIEVKGKGLMNTYLWAPPESDSHRALLLCRGLATHRHTLTTSCSGGGAGDSDSKERLPHLHRRHQPGQQQRRRQQQLGRLRSAAAANGGPASDSGASFPPGSSSGNEAASSPHHAQRQRQRRRRSSGAGDGSSSLGPPTCPTYIDNWTHLRASLGDCCSGGVEDDSIYSLVTLLLPK